MKQEEKLFLFTVTTIGFNFLLWFFFKDDPEIYDLKTKIFVIVFSVIAVGVHLVSFFKSSVRKEQYKEFEQAQRIDDNTTSFRVLYCSKERFDKMSQRSIWEVVNNNDGSGLLQFGQDFICFEGKTNSHKVLQFKVAKQKKSLEVVHSKKWQTFPLSWIKINDGDVEHYLTLDTGTFIFGSQEGQEKMYQEFVKSL